MCVRDGREEEGGRVGTKAKVVVEMMLRRRRGSRRRRGALGGGGGAAALVIARGIICAVYVGLGG
jgi:hypothetical protein